MVQFHPEPQNLNLIIMITEDYVSFETAKLLKEKGFDVESYASIKVFGGNMYEINGEWITPTEDTIIPTLQMAMKWLREVHKIHIEIGYNIGYFPVCIFTKTNATIPYKPIQGKDFTYEQACEAAIKYCLENLI